MTVTKILKSPFRYRMWRRKHLALLVSDLGGGARQAEQDNAVHLRAALDWLCRAQDVRDGLPDEGGVSAGWSFEDGWLPSYPETSGYIVETLIAAAALLEHPALRSRAQRIVDWELSIQNADGSFPGHFGESGSRPVIFNTGQIIHGMVAGYLEFGREDCLEAAVKAGHWMARCQDDDGCWRRNVHNAVPHTYNTRAAWGLLRAALLAGDGQLQGAAMRNLEWALTQQTPSGWFRTNAFVADAAPFTHTIAYAIRGLLEAGLLIEAEQFVASAKNAALALAKRQRRDGSLAGTYADGWIPKSSYCCLTGLAQMTVIWQRLRDAVDESQLGMRTSSALRYLKQRQRIGNKGGPEDGSIAGSAPIWGRYSMFEFPNWATKFFADALMMETTGIVIPRAHAGKPLRAAAVNV